MSYEFIAKMLKEGAGTKGMKFFPLVFSLFMFVLTANLLGMFPYFFTVTSQIIVTFALAMLVIGTVLVYGFYQARLPLSQCFRAVGRAGHAVAAGGRRSKSSRSCPGRFQLSVRLFANMLAGHITLKVFAGFVASLGALGAARHRRRHASARS